MQPHPTLRPYLVREGAGMTLVVPVEADGIPSVWRIALDDRTQLRMLRDLAAAAYDASPHASLRQRHDKGASSHGQRFQPIDIIGV